MSWPAQKAGPVAARTTARTARSAAISRSVADSAAIRASDRLLRALGRLSVRTEIPWASSRSRMDGAEGATRAAELGAFMVSLCDAGTTLYPIRIGGANRARARQEVPHACAQARRRGTRTAAGGRVPENVQSRDRPS